MDTLDPKPAAPEDLNRSGAGSSADVRADEPEPDYEALLLDTLVRFTPDAPPGQFMGRRVEGEMLDLRQWVHSTQGHMIAERTRRGYIMELARLAGKVLDKQGKAFETFNDRTDPEWLYRATQAAGVGNMVQHVRYGGYAPTTMRMLHRALMWLLLQTEMVPPGRLQAQAMGILNAHISDLKHATRQAKQGGEPHPAHPGAAPDDAGSVGVDADTDTDTGADADAKADLAQAKADEAWLANFNGIEYRKARLAAGKPKTVIRPPKRTIAEADFAALMKTLATSRNKAGPLWKERVRLFLLATLATAARPVEWQQAAWKDASRTVLRLPNYKIQRIPHDRSWWTSIPADLAEAAQADLESMGVKAALTNAAWVDPSTLRRLSAQAERGVGDEGGEGDDEPTTTLDQAEVLGILKDMLSSSVRLAKRLPELNDADADEGVVRARIWQELVRVRAWQIHTQATVTREVVVPLERQADVQAHLRSVRLHLAGGLSYEAYYDGCRYSLMNACRQTFGGDEARFCALYDARATALANLKANVEDWQALGLIDSGNKGARGGRASAGGRGGLSKVAALMLSAAAGHFGQGSRTVHRRYPPRSQAWSRAGRASYAPMLATDSATQRLMVQSMSASERESLSQLELPADESKADHGDAPAAPGSDSGSASGARP